MKRLPQGAKMYSPLPAGEGVPGYQVGVDAMSFRNTSGEKVRVSRVIDGDTIVVSGGRRVRYIGIDTPEVGDSPQLFGREATIFNEALVSGRTVVLQSDVSNEDRFGRLLRFVYADGILVNAELVREGYAKAKVYPPDTQYAECLAALEMEARQSGRGMWSGQ